MCGIFGIISNNSSINIGKLNSVSKTLKHRGPDDEGFFLFNIQNHQCYKGDDTQKTIDLPHLTSSHTNYNSALLHRRLSIIDLSESGHQPMSYNGGKLWITFNGEIYNYKEIRGELITKGYHFYSSSDTEVILAAYQEWGENCVVKFNGMWAFAIWDNPNQTLFLSRDRFGIKPLYYFKNEKSIIFSSEIKGIRNYLSPQNTGLSERKLYQFYQFGQIIIGESDETLFNNIYQLNQGSNLIYRGNNISLSTYYKLEISGNKLSFNENKENFKFFFKNSIAYRLISDVEVGSCLSGGIDSSSIVSYGATLFNKQFHTFSAIWPGEKCDESFYIDKVNIRHGCHVNAFTPDLSKILEDLNRATWYQEIPLAGSSLMAQWYVMEAASRIGIKVLLDGQGADEISYGYPRFVLPFYRRLFYSFRFKKLLFNIIANRNKTGFKSIIKALFLKNKMRQTFYIPLIEADLNYSMFVLPDEYFSWPFAFDKLSDLLKFEIERINLPSLLHFEDRNSMAHSVEARVPYLDYRLVEFALSIPPEQQINGMKTKMIIRESMKEYLPIEVYNRTDKIGFATPVENLLFSSGSHLYKEIISTVNNSDFFLKDRVVVDKLNPDQLFSLYSLILFERQFR